MAGENALARAGIGVQGKLSGVLAAQGSNRQARIARVGHGDGLRTADGTDILMAETQVIRQDREYGLAAGSCDRDVIRRGSCGGHDHNVAALRSGLGRAELNLEDAGPSNRDRKARTGVVHKRELGSIRGDRGDRQFARTGIRHGHQLDAARRTHGLYVEMQLTRRQNVGQHDQSGARNECDIGRGRGVRQNIDRSADSPVSAGLEAHHESAGAAGRQGLSGTSVGRDRKLGQRRYQGGDGEIGLAGIGQGEGHGCRRGSDQLTGKAHLRGRNRELGNRSGPGHCDSVGCRRRIRADYDMSGLCPCGRGVERNIEGAA